MLNQEQIQGNKEKFISLVRTAGELNEKKKGTNDERTNQ